MRNLLIIILIFLQNVLYAQPIPDRIPVYQTSHWGYCDTTGKIVIPAIYLKTQPFTNDYALVMDTFAKWGIINKKGTEILPCQYDAIEGFRSGFARVNKDGFFGFINSQFKEAVPLKITKNLDKPNDCLKREGAATSGLIAFDTLGNFITLDKKYDDVGDFSQGLCWVTKSNKGGFINAKFEEVIPLGDYQEQGGKPIFTEGLCGLKINGKYGYIDKTGKEGTPFKFDVGYPYSAGRAAVCYKWKWGYINKAGKEITKMEYDFAYPFADGMAIAIKNDKYGYIDSTGKNVIACQFYRSSDFRQGYAIATQYAKNFLINKKGQKASREFDQLTFLNNIFYLAYIGKKHGVISMDGKEILPCRYKDITWYSYEFNLGIVIDEHGKYGLINSKGKFIIPCVFDFLEMRAGNLIYSELFNIDGKGSPVKNVYVGDVFCEKAFLQQGFFDFTGKKYF